jgi:hypothetical protein
MSPVTGFVVYDILFWSFIAIVALIATRDHFARHISERGTRVARDTEVKEFAKPKS